MKALFILLPTLLISASHLTDAAAIPGAQNVDLPIGIPPVQGPTVGDGLNGQPFFLPYYHPNIHFGNDGLGGQPFPLPYYHPNIHFGNDGESGKAASGNGGSVPPVALHPNVLLQRPSTWTDIRDAAEDAALKGLLGSLSGGGGFFVVPPLHPLQQQQPPINLPPQQPPAVHPHVLLQRPDAWSEARDAAERAAAQAGGKAVGDAVGKEVGNLLGGLFGR